MKGEGPAIALALLLFAVQVELALIIPSMRNRRPMLISAAMAVVVGSIGLSQLMEKPRFATYHTVDVVQMLGSGACFGVALTTVFVFFGIGRFAARSKTD